MRIAELLQGATRPVFSFEFFPPKTEAGEENLRSALKALQQATTRIYVDPQLVSYAVGIATATRFPAEVLAPADAE